MRQKKPFKVGATYKLKKKYLDMYTFTTRSIMECRRLFGKDRAPFTMQVVSLKTGVDCTNVACYAKMVNDTATRVYTIDTGTMSSAEALEYLDEIRENLESTGDQFFVTARERRMFKRVKK